MDVTIILARMTNLAIGGYIDALGLGWDIIGPSPLGGFTVMAQIKAPLDWGDEPIEAHVQLIDSAGEPVVQRADDQEQVVEVRGLVQLPPSAQRPPGLPAGATMLMEFAPGIVLEPGIYTWVATVQGETKPHWRRSFYVRAKADEYPPSLQLGELPGSRP